MNKQISVNEVVAPNGWKFALTPNGDKILGASSSDGVNPEVYTIPTHALMSDLPYDPGIGAGVVSVDGFIVERLSDADIIADLKERLAGESALLANALVEVNEIKVSMSNRNRELGDALRHISIKDDQLEEMGLHVRRLSEQQNEALLNAGDLEKELTDCEKESIEVKSFSASLSKDLHQERIKTCALESLRDNLFRQVDDLESKLSARELKIKTLIDRRDDLYSKCLDYDNKIDTLKAGHHKALKNLGKKLSAKCVEVRNLTALKDDLYGACHRNADEADDAVREAGILKIKLNTEEGKAGVLEDEIDKLEALCGDLQHRIFKTNTESLQSYLDGGEFAHVARDVMHPINGDVLIPKGAKISIGGSMNCEPIRYISATLDDCDMDFTGLIGWIIIHSDESTANITITENYTGGDQAPKTTSHAISNPKSVGSGGL